VEPAEAQRQQKNAQARCLPTHDALPTVLNLLPISLDIFLRNNKKMKKIGVVASV